MKKLYILLFISVSVLLSCKKEGDSQRTNYSYQEDPSLIQDRFGRQLILHGLNTSSSAKSHPERLPWIEERHVEREAKEYGFNFVRYLIFWDAIEPQKDVFDEAYLDKVGQRVNWYASRGMYVMLDMHQDLYSLKFGGDGAPEWACRTNGMAPISLPGETPWWLKNIDPAVITCWVNFWAYTDHKDLQDHYILAWKKVMQRFKNNPYVIGYDLMNEPWGGDLIKVFITGEFERNQLSAFYNRMIPQLRTVDNQKHFFFEPTPAPVTFGAPSNLPKISDSRSVTKLGYAPHCYPYDTHEGGGYTASSKQQLKDWERERKKDVALHGGIPLVCGEFGLSPTNAGYEEYLRDVNAMFDRNQWHWTYWSNDRGGWSPFDGDQVLPLAQHLLRVFPHATAGKINTFSFDPATKVFNMNYVNNASIPMPTEIFIPRQLYPGGWKLNISGTSDYTQTFDEATQILKIRATEDNASITVEIVAD